MSRVLSGSLGAKGAVVRVRLASVARCGANSVEHKGASPPEFLCEKRVECCDKSRGVEVSCACVVWSSVAGILSPAISNGIILYLT